MQRFSFYLIFLILMNGCAPLVVGAGGVLLGKMISEDTSQTYMDCSFDDLYNICKDVLLEKNVEIKKEDPKAGRIFGTLGMNSIKIRIDSISAQTQRLRVTCRKGPLPNISLAEEFLIEIVREAE